jgi:hypothetical protein
MTAKVTNALRADANIPYAVVRYGRVVGSVVHFKQVGGHSAHKMGEHRAKMASRHVWRFTFQLVSGQNSIVSVY